MPLVASSYHPPLWLRNGHLQTVWPVLTRRLEVPYTRELSDTPDGDVLALDWLRAGFDRVAILSHGLEGSTSSPYLRGMAYALHSSGWDVLAWNNRGCGGTPNRKAASYHSGFTDDLAFLVEQTRGYYPQVALVGFSMGGNVTLKYLGERAENVPAEVVAAVVFSVPVSLGASAERLAAPYNTVYMRRFLRSLRLKLEAKRTRYPEIPALEGFERIRNFREFDDRFTAPLFGFRDAEDYWAKASSIMFLGDIKTPTLLVNALDDPFLPQECFPVGMAKKHPHLHLETPRWGGHCGFVLPGGFYWSEQRALSFLESVAPPSLTLP